MSDTVSFSKQGAIGLIKVNNPPVNALNQSVRAGLKACVEQGLGDDSVKAMVLICEGRTFIAGADIAEFAKGMGEPGLVPVIGNMETASKPIVAAIHGTALGGGLEVALGCHYRVALASAKVGLPEVHLGLLPGAGGTQRLTRFVGKSKAMDMCLTGRMMNAEEAERSGLVSRVVPLDDLEDEAIKAAATIAKLSRPVVMMCKESVNKAYETTLREGIMFERRLFHSTFATEDQKEGMAAFAEKRSPSFKNK